MAQTRKRRQTKHRGNAAGMVESRGRTGRAPRVDKKQAKLDAKAQARAKRLARLDQPPTWRGALNRAGIAALFFLIVLLVIMQQPFASAVVLAAVTLLIYIPMSYYTDLFIYRRRQRQKATRKAGA
jgi:hypothetical protein